MSPSSRKISGSRSELAADRRCEQVCDNWYDLAFDSKHCNRMPETAFDLFSKIRTEIVTEDGLMRTRHELRQYLKRLRPSH